MFPTKKQQQLTSTFTYHCHLNTFVNVSTLMFLAGKSVAIYFLLKKDAFLSKQLTGFGMKINIEPPPSPGRGKEEEEEVLRNNIFN